MGKRNIHGSGTLRSLKWDLFLLFNNVGTVPREETVVVLSTVFPVYVNNGICMDMLK